MACIFASLLCFPSLCLNIALERQCEGANFKANYSVHRETDQLPGMKSESEVRQSCPTLCDPVDCSHQAPAPMGFSRQEYWSGLPSSSPGDLPDPGIEPRSPTLQAEALTSDPPGMKGGQLQKIYWEKFCLSTVAGSQGTT